MAFTSALEARGMLLMGRPGNRWRTMMSLIRCIAFLATVMTVICGVAVLLICLPDVFIGELSFRAQDYASLHLVDLLLTEK